MFGSGFIPYGSLFVLPELFL